ncbi:MAG TPA: energy transducer TonB [bacterium]|nr:energy transducer TonB [bacterium]
MEFMPDRGVIRDKSLVIALALSVLVHLGVAAAARGFMERRPRLEIVEVDLSHITRLDPSRLAPASPEPAKPVRPEPRPKIQTACRPEPAPAPDPAPDPVTDDEEPPPPADPGPAADPKSEAVDAGPSREVADASGPSSGIAGRPDPFRSYRGKVARRIERARKVYPYRSRLQENREEGTVSVRFVIQPSGAVRGVEVAKSSGHPLLDQAAVEIVENAAPFPPLPPELGISELPVNSPIRFTLRTP